jgi:hypothetical protein
LVGRVYILEPFAAQVGEIDIASASRIFQFGFPDICPADMIRING